MGNSRTTRSATADTVVDRIVEQVADREGIEPTELRPPLYDVVDPEALTDLFAATERGPDRGSGRVTFEYNGYEVVVDSDGDVSFGDGGRRATAESETVR